MTNTSIMYDVRCPKCRAQAVAVMVPISTRGTYREAFVNFGAARITCAHCGFSRQTTTGGEEDYELWYVTEFDGQRLWARNRRHLDCLIDWLVRGGDILDASIDDRAYVEALPKWLRTSKNRPAILKKLRRLRGDDDC